MIVMPPPASDSHTANPLSCRTWVGAWSRRLATLLHCGGGALAILVGASFTSRAVTDPVNQFAMQTWLTEDGMPQNTVTALLQTRAGYIWAATYNGIAQFDGVRFKVFDSSNTEGLPNSRITSLFEDARGDIWIGHDTGDLTKFSGGRFQPVTPRRNWSGGTIYGIQSDPAGDVWILNIHGEALRVRDELLIQPPSELREGALLVPQFVLDDQRRLLVVRNGYVAELTPAGYRLVTFPTPSNRPYHARLATAARGGLWVPGAGRMRRWSGNAWQDDLGEFPWGDASIMCLLATTADQLLVGTLQRGLFIHDPALGWMNITRTNGLPQDWVRCLIEDREHNLWVGSSGGLTILRPRKVVMLSPPGDWQGHPVQAITRARDGSVWAASEGDGLYRWRNDDWTRYGVEAGLSNLFVWSVLEDSAGKIWAGTWGGGLFRREENRFVEQFDLAARGEAVTALKELPAGTLWIGTAAGLLRWSSNKLERFAALGGAMAGDIRALESGAEGELWIGTQGSGLGRFQDGKFQTWREPEGLPRDFILSLLQDSDGTLWIGSLDRGIFRFRHGKFVTISTEAGLPNNVIGHIADDGVGNLWLNTQKGLVRVRKRDLNECADGKLPAVVVRVFGEAEGMTTPAGSSGFSPSGFRSPDGRLWFPTARGIAVVDPKSVPANLVPPAVWIEDILVDGEHAKLSAPARNAAMPATGHRPVILTPGRHQLEIFFTGISFTAPKRVRFNYQLEGLESSSLDHSQTKSTNRGLEANGSEGSSRHVTYPYLPPGQYTFHVNAGNSDGVWNPTGDAVTILVLPHPWQTWWFKTILGVLSFLVVGGGVYWQSRRRLRARLERVARERELERERARIAQDIHDDLGASLTRIGMLSESASEDLLDPPRAARSLGQIYATARDLTRAMDEIVWAVNPRHDTLDSLANYITRFAHDFLSAADIRCRLDAPMTFPELVVRSEIRHNLFLAFKETLNNAVKHSGASEIRVTLERVAGGFKLIVADNGSGFAGEKAVPDPAPGRLVSGYGIAGIRTRLEQIGGSVRITSQPGEGTRVELFVPLAEAAG